MTRGATPGEPPVDIDPTLVARPRRGLVPVAVGDELVLLDGWNAATSLNATGALLWSCLDGQTTLGALAAELAEDLAVDEAEVLANLARFIGELGQQGLLEDVDPSSPDLDLQLHLVPPPGPGDVVDDLELHDLDGVGRRVGDLVPAGTVLLVNWSPHCGYCARIVHQLADQQVALAAARCQLVLVATGSVQANRALVDAAGLDVPVLLLSPHQDLFQGAGTPSAYHLDPTGRILGTPAHGAGEVPALAARIAGVEEATVPSGTSEPVRYLLERDGLCAPIVGQEDTVAWAGTRVYRVGDHHIGIRHDSAATADVLDRLFLGRRVDDPRAGHSFSVALDLEADGRRRPRRLNLLVQAGQPTVRTRDPARVIAALLSRLREGVEAFDPTSGRLQVEAIAVLHDSGAALLPWNLHAFAPRLQPLLARSGLAMADVRHPEIDLVTAEVVIPGPAFDHDRRVLDAFGAMATASGERPFVAEGRYPLTAWCAIHPGEAGATPFSPAEAAAATLSSVLHTDDAAARVRQLGELFGRVGGFGLWYDREPELMSAVAEALQGPPR